MFNAKVETITEKPSFREPMKSRRCLIPADGYYEWTVSDDGGKDPWFIHLPGHKPYFFAGLWAHNDQLGITSCTIITASAITPVDQVHTRMPIVLDPAAYDRWLDPATPVEDAKALLLAQNRDDELEFYRVHRQVNDRRYQDAGAILPI